MELNKDFLETEVVKYEYVLYNVINRAIIKGEILRIFFIHISPFTIC